MLLNQNYLLEDVSQPLNDGIEPNFETHSWGMGCFDRCVHFSWHFASVLRWQMRYSRSSLTSEFGDVNIFNFFYRVKNEWEMKIAGIVSGWGGLHERMRKGKIDAYYFFLMHIFMTLNFEWTLRLKWTMSKNVGRSLVDKLINNLRS